MSTAAHTRPNQRSPAHRTTLQHVAVAILNTAAPMDKVAMTAAAYEFWTRQVLLPIKIPKGPPAHPPDRPARPAAPPLLPPTQVPRRRINSAPGGRIALLHAIAHIELNAIDLAWDIIARFGTDMPDAFLTDWCQIACEEGFHFAILCHRLHQLNAKYGDLPAHDGLWDAAKQTANDLLARLAVVPMVLEARGLDVTPQMIQKLTQVGDMETVALLQRIHDDEIGHVAAGKRWFDFTLSKRHQNTQDAKHAWQNLIATHFKGDLKPPFNKDSRDKATLPYDWYAPLATKSP